IGHLGSFFVIGVLVAAVYQPHARNRSLLRYLVPVAVGCFILETAQFFQFGRHARVIDLTLNVTGFGLGLWLTDSWEKGRTWRMELQSLEKRRPYLEVVVLTIALLIWWGFSLQPAFGSLRMEWDRSCRLSIVNEVGGARPWLGEVRYCGVFGRAL